MRPKSLHQVDETDKPTDPIGLEANANTICPEEFCVASLQADARESQMAYQQIRSQNFEKEFLAAWD